MRLLCNQTGCTNVLGRTYSPMCSTHRRAWARWGHPLQTAILLPELKAFEQVLQRRMADNKDSEAWRLLSGRLQGIVDRCAAVIETVSAGRPYCRIDRLAAEEVLAVTRLVPAEVILVRCLAVGMLWASQANRFHDDRAFVFCLSRLFLRLGPGNGLRYWNDKQKRMSTVSRDRPPRVLELVGSWLVQAFAGPAAQLVELERTRRDPREVEAERLRDALAALKA